MTYCVKPNQYYKAYSIFICLYSLQMNLCKKKSICGGEAGGRMGGGEGRALSAQRDYN